MTNTFTNDTLLSGIYFDKDFQKVRDRRISNWSISPEVKKSLEESIKRGKGVVRVENTGTMNCQNDVEGKNQS